MQTRVKVGIVWFGMAWHGMESVLSQMTYFFRQYIDKYGSLLKSFFSIIQRKISVYLLLLFFLSFNHTCLFVFCVSHPFFFQYVYLFLSFSPWCWHFFKSFGVLFSHCIVLKLQNEQAIFLATEVRIGKWAA